ncbi:Uncharacterized protein HII31_05301 [Pseudocercospora fuligena]|uniref:Copper acquisition factor BIM1-like domain-containing protein n=1 Tax=Pseudocercospora fuligena TaxID=685502 RepID=A0A8H6RLV7_9PEZI|nr:Uncharacterized protein HII31_05301 [Pseudocercospora fuligena]
MSGIMSTFTIAVVALSGLARAHTVITYPGWRGNNLHTNGTAPQFNPETVGIDYNQDNDTWGYPFGMQWMYPCGGMGLTTNRTHWPVGGGAISVQPGWFPGHSKAFFYVNIGIQEEGQMAPPNYSHPVVPPFEVTGPSNSQYPGQFCLPQVRMPANVSLSPGQNITIQVIETAQHGAALYSCVDVTLEENGSPLVEEVTPQNCYNSSNLGFQQVFTTEALTAGASSLAAPSTVLALTVMVATALFALS